MFLGMNVLKEFARAIFILFALCPSLPPSHLVPSKLKMATAINRPFQTVCVFSHLRPRDTQGNLPFAFHNVHTPYASGLDNI